MYHELVALWSLAQSEQIKTMAETAFLFGRIAAFSSNKHYLCPPFFSEKRQWEGNYIVYKL